MTSKDPYQAYRAAITRLVNCREDMVWASAAGIPSEPYSAAKLKYEKALGNLHSQVEKLLEHARQEARHDIDLLGGITE